MSNNIIICPHCDCSYRESEDFNHSCVQYLKSLSEQVSKKVEVLIEKIEVLSKKVEVLSNIINFHH